MKRLFVVSALVLGSFSSAAAQDRTSPYSDAHLGPLSVVRSAPPAPRGSFGLEPSQPSSELSSEVAEPAPKPAPRFLYGASDDFRWQVANGFEYVRFRSTPFDASLFGLHTSVSYYTNNWFAVEGSIVAAFGTKPFATMSKYLLYTGGPRIASRGRKWEPWGHALFGGVHMIPQIAGGFSQNSFAIQLGGGADFRFLPQLSARFEADYVRTGLYSEHQNNFQFGTGIVVHF